jgi:hypothetical protein
MVGRAVLSPPSPDLADPVGVVATVEAEPRAIWLQSDLAVAATATLR